MNDNDLTFQQTGTGRVSDEALQQILVMSVPNADSRENTHTLLNRLIAAQAEDE